ncbi:WXG100 family type VII secretion target [Leucobacter allii]|uniref:ESAT-6-like protein n=1 Tax=Leucobacter allii TaxID=2932247 RepID=A0ABY4FIG3_9MICO|nr:WXG100 family type VII secretion target [Leucobacter allii]UOQ56482.1 WXG100 family type VII secretion target [Leucobacter allii]UOR00916.1 WXG100 family type VII secretion target [Leucobacter allii]
MANITVSYAEIERAAVQLANGREEITQRLHALRAMIASLVSSGFTTDQASGRFDAAYQEYTAGANTVIARLDEIQQFLTQTAQALRDMDAQIAARIN